MKIGVALTFLAFTLVNLAASDASEDIEASNEFNAGLALPAPMIRFSIKDYINNCGDKKRKLLLGEGHIYDLENLPAEFKVSNNPEEEGYQSLTFSVLNGQYDFHQNVVFYTASAETSKAFGSDWSGNFQKENHRVTLFLPDTFDLVFDASYTPNAVSEALYSDIAKSLRVDGIFITPLQISQSKSLFKCGHKTCHHTMDWYAGKISFETLEAVYKFWEDFLKEKGFSKVEFYESPLNLLVSDLHATHRITSTNIEEWTEQDNETFENAMQTFDEIKAKESKTAIIEPHLAHYGLSLNYLVAYKQSKSNQ